jgi:hypothetical protein
MCSQLTLFIELLLEDFKFPCNCNCMLHVTAKLYKVTTLAVCKMDILCFDKAVFLASFGSLSVEV